MTVRTFECRAPRTGEGLGFVSLSRVEEWPADVHIVRVRIGDDWRCALLDRSRVVEVEGALLRDAVASDGRDCPECVAAPPVPVAAASEPARRSDPSHVQAAAISLAGVKMVVVLVRRDLVDSPGEAAMLVDLIRPRFGNAAIVLMGQDEDGTAHYHGDPDDLALLQGVPVERMPWKTYSLN